MDLRGGDEIDPDSIFFAGLTEGSHKSSYSPFPRAILWVLGLSYVSRQATSKQEAAVSLRQVWLSAEVVHG